ncbi:MAG: hypothetical protein Q9191_005390 [Dirinaria sp. TL-2023a]
MGKKKKQLTQAEIWDDSALIKSWDDALEEYKLYHSVYARGERVEDVLREAEARNKCASIAGSSVDSTNSAMPAQMDEARQSDLEEGEVEDGNIVNGKCAEPVIESAEQTPLPNGSVPQKPSLPPIVDSTAQLPSVASMPNPILNNTKDEYLKNLMMSWYYAGYYTGLYEGQQQAIRNQATPENS